MGMLMHHTWAEQQKKAKDKPKAPAAKPVETKPEPVNEPVRNTRGRRKTK